MAIPRRNLFDPSMPVLCHCVSRCVRKLLLLAGEMSPRGKDGTPRRTRKDLLADRLRQLTAIFAIDVLEWAILDNHVHLVLATHPELVALWTDREVAERWRTLTPDYQWRRRRGIPYTDQAHEEEIAAMLSDPKLLERARRALADVSQFHKFLKQRIAKLINGIDDVTGHLWEGRFNSIVAADAGALIAHMVYVALNPFRAGLSDRPETCDFTSLQSRIDELRRRIDEGEFPEEVAEARRTLRELKLLPALPCDPGDAVRCRTTLPDGRPNPWAGGGVASVVEGLTLSAYLNELDRAARVEHPWKSRRTLASEAPRLLELLERELEEKLRGRSARCGGGATSAADPPSPALSAPPAEVPADLSMAARYAVPLEASLSRGLSNAIGHFSGGLAAVARRAAALGRKAVWTIFDPVGDAPRRRVSAAACE
jgi:REP element-mobilizing transposase RayT